MFPTRARLAQFGAVLCCGLILLPAAPLARAEAPDDERSLGQWSQRAQALVPRSPADCRDARRVEAVARACQELDAWAMRVGTVPQAASRDEAVRRVEHLLAAQARVDRFIDDLLALRKELGQEPAGAQRLELLGHYLRISDALIDLSGRLRYQLEETIGEAAYRVAASAPMRERLLDLLAKHHSSVGAEIMADLLFDPPADAPNGALAASPAVKRQVLRLIYTSGCNEAAPLLADFVRRERRAPELVIAAAAALRQVGFPQDPRPGDRREQFRPPITAAQLLTILKAFSSTALDAANTRLRDELIQWLESRQEQGLAGDSYRIGSCEVHPGDWMLMRSPSPYNRVTELSPGLFTHVGIVALEKGSDGRRRLVVVDLTVRDTHLRVTNVDAFIRQYRHYLFLRHPDEATARTMAEVARSIIGNESVFDLNYRIDNVTALKGRPKSGQTIKTYCAGLLLLCGQETRVDRARFFPVTERIAGGKTAANLKALGISFGEHFVSPTGPLFSAELTIVGRRPPMYDPVNEIEEAVYDHFTTCLRQYDLADKRDSYQQIRVSLAQASKGNPALGRLLAQLNNVNPSMDLVSAAKAAAVQENLDAAAMGNSRQFSEAFFALTAGPLERLPKEEYKQADLQRYQALRQRHAELYRQLTAGSIDTGALRKALVAYYVRQGKTEIEKQFKVGAESMATPPGR